MDMRRIPDDPALAALEAEFPAWGFIVSDKGRWWALRGPLPMDKLNERDAFDADTATELRAALRAHGWGDGKLEGSL